MEKLVDLINEYKNPQEQTNNLDLFVLPINYIEEKYPIQDCIKTDLELLPEKDQLSLYNYVFNPLSDDANKIIPMWSNYYTTNTNFLKDTQSLVKNFTHIESPNASDINNIHEILNDVNEETGFYEKYKFVDINFFKFLNNYPLFLQGLTLYNLASPVISLIIPIIMLILPFFLLKFQKVPISMQTYIEVLIKVLKNHIVGKAFTEFANVGWDRRFFLLITICFYFINIYQNIISCRTFYKNIYKIRDYLLSINKYLVYSINSITNLNTYCKSSYNSFINMNEKIKQQLIAFSTEISYIKLEKISVKQITKIGNILKSFYQLFQNKIYKESIIYSLYLHGYIENISALQNNISNKSINYCKFTKKSVTFNNAYFGTLVKQDPIKNSYNLKKNIIITGPNAAGKTTLLKTTLFNVILSQQLGLGFYEKASINPYKYIHSYINIPDTSGRDSLFQAEARRCKEILDIIQLTERKDRHFCIFDEIYSGTNPTEAIASAYSFLQYISKFKNVDFILTTHYISLCKLLDKHINIINKQMFIKNEENTYKLVNNISTVRGGIKVLEELNYNEEIISSAKKIIDKIII